MRHVSIRDFKNKISHYIETHASAHDYTVLADLKENSLILGSGQNIIQRIWSYPELAENDGDYDQIRLTMFGPLLRMRLFSDFSRSAWTR